MKTKYLHPKLLLSLLAPVTIASTTSISSAQETPNSQTPEKREITPDESELLKKGNTWSYDVSVQIPDSVKFESSLKGEGERAKNSVIYKFEEIQQSTGLSEIEALGRPAPIINIYIEGKLTKRQVLEYRGGSLLYYGTYQHDPKNPELKKGMISISPILLYNQGSKSADKWSWSATGLPEFQFRVEAKGVDIEVKGNKYIVDKIQMDQVNQTTKDVMQSKEIWFAKDIGIVKEREKNYTQDGKAIIKILELNSFVNMPLIETIK